MFVAFDTNVRYEPDAQRRTNAEPVAPGVVDATYTSADVVAMFELSTKFTFEIAFGAGVEVVAAVKMRDARPAPA